MAGGYAALMVVALAMLSVAMFGPAPQILAIHNAHTGSAIVMNGGMAITVALMLGFYPVFGIVGVAAAYTIGSFAVSLVLWRYTLHRTGIDCSIFALKTGLAAHKANPLTVIRAPGAYE